MSADQNLSKGATAEEGSPLLSLAPQQIRRLAEAPSGHLSTASRSGVPHVIPVCFALGPQQDGPFIYIALDQKPKRAALTRLRRVRNILENPQVALVVDHYDADWTKLWYILLTGTAELLDSDEPSPRSELASSSGPTISAHPETVPRPGPVRTAHPGPGEGRGTTGERRHAIQLLRRKYPQYRDMDIDGNPAIKITPLRSVAWSYTPESTP